MPDEGLLPVYDFQAENATGPSHLGAGIVQTKRPICYPRAIHSIGFTSCIVPCILQVAAATGAAVGVGAAVLGAAGATAVAAGAGAALAVGAGALSPPRSSPVRLACCLFARVPR